MILLIGLQTSVADPERFDADPDLDPTFQADADPDPNLFIYGEKKFSSKSSPILSKILPNLTV